VTRGRLALLALLGSLAGCGTMENVLDVQHEERRLRPYGGVAADFQACNDILQQRQPDGYFPGMNLVLPTVKGLCCCVRLVDVPISVVTDTLTLPLTLNHVPRTGMQDQPVQSMPAVIMAPAEATAQMKALAPARLTGVTLQAQAE
jgi:uncharacterized protein YceK